MPNINYTPKASLLALPYSVRFVGEDYAIALHDGENEVTDEELAALQENEDVQTIYKDVIHFSAPKRVAKETEKPSEKPAAKPSSTATSKVI